MPRPESHRPNAAPLSGPGPTWGSDLHPVPRRYGYGWGSPVMYFRLARWLAVLAATGLAGFAVNAQTPQPPPTSPGIPVSPQLPPSVGLDRLQSLVSPPEPGLPAGQLAGPTPA